MLTLNVGDQLILEFTADIYGYWNDAQVYHIVKFKKGTIFNIIKEEKMGIFILSKKYWNKEFSSFWSGTNINKTFRKRPYLNLKRKLLL